MSGGVGSTGWSGNEVPVPKKKILSYQNMEFTYDYETGILLITSAGKEMSFDVVELKELRAALATLGIGISPGSPVSYR